MKVTAARERAVLAGRTSKLGAEHPDTLEAKRAHTAAMLEAHISRVVDQAPALSTEQRAKLAAILLGAA